MNKLRYIMQEVGALLCGALLMHGFMSDGLYHLLMWQTFIARVMLVVGLLVIDTYVVRLSTGLVRIAGNITLGVLLYLLGSVISQEHALLMVFGIIMFAGLFQAMNMFVKK